MFVLFSTQNLCVGYPPVKVISLASKAVPSVILNNPENVHFLCVCVCDCGIAFPPKRGVDDDDVLFFPENDRTNIVKMCFRFFFAAGEIEFSNPSALLWTNMRRRERVFTVLSRFLSMGKTEKRKQKQKLDASEGLGCVLVFKRRYGFVHFTAQFSVK